MNKEKPTGDAAKPEEHTRYLEQFFRGMRTVKVSEQTGVIDRSIRYLPALNILKQIVFQTILIFGPDWGVSQLVVLAGLDVSILICNCVMRPQAKMMNFVFQTAQLISESLIGLSLITAFSLGNSLNIEDEQNYFGNALLIFFSVSIISSGIPLIIGTIQGVWQLLKPSKQNKISPSPAELPVNPSENQLLNNHKPSPDTPELQRRNSNVTTKSGTVKSGHKPAKPTQQSKPGQQKPLQFGQNQTNKPPKAPQIQGPKNLQPKQGMVKQILPQQGRPFQPTVGSPNRNQFQYTGVMGQPPYSLWPTGYPPQ